MSRKSVIARDRKRRKLVERFYDKKVELKAIVKDINKPFNEKMEAQHALSKISRDASVSRLRNRCAITGRPRGYMGFFGISRIKFRKLASAGLLPGVKKASW
jgi:small subunit ribosomal protein S14